MTSARMPRNTYLISRDQHAWLQRIEQQMGLKQSQILRMALTYASRQRDLPAFVQHHLVTAPCPRTASIPKSFTLLPGHILFIDGLVAATTASTGPTPPNHSSVLRAILAFCARVPVATLVNAASVPA